MITKEDLSNMLRHWMITRQVGGRYLGSDYASVESSSPMLSQLLRDIPAFNGKAIAIQPHCGSYAVLLADGSIITPT